MLGATWTVRIAPEARGLVERFLAEDCFRERGGFLLGRLVAGGRGETIIDRALPCPDAPSTAVSLTFRAEEWQLLHSDAAFCGGSQVVVGWFHSHPSMPVGMSARDCFIQRNFFSHPLQVAWIRDPVGGEEAVWGFLEDRPVRLGCEGTAA